MLRTPMKRASVRLLLTIARTRRVLFRGRQLRHGPSTPSLAFGYRDARGADRGAPRCVGRRFRSGVFSCPGGSGGYGVCVWRVRIVRAGWKRFTSQRAERACSMRCSVALRSSLRASSGQRREAKEVTVSANADGHRLVRLSLPDDVVKRNWISHTVTFEQRTRHRVCAFSCSAHFDTDD
jgi:hypothetical protein